MSLDIRMQPLAVDVNVPPQEAIDAGAPAEALLTFTAALVLPFQDPNTGGPLVAPLGNVSFKLDRDAALAVAGKLQEEGEKLPQKSNLTVASDLSDVARQAEAVEKLKKGD